MDIPDSVQGDLPRSLYVQCNDARGALRSVARDIQAIRDDARPNLSAGVDVEVIANVTLAYRHIEDASMRLGKALQALDGGASVYDKATTVGA